MTIDPDVLKIIVVLVNRLGGSVKITPREVCEIPPRTALITRELDFGRELQITVVQDALPEMPE